MPILKLKRILFTLLSLTILLSSCEELFPKDDPCDNTVTDEISVKIRVRIFEDLADELTVVEIDVYKVPCGAPKKGEFHFQGETVDGFYQQDYEVGYNLRNKGDVIVIEINAVSFGPMTSINISETIEYSYSDFTDGELKDPLVILDYPK